jgi:hypothetical protein
VPFSCFFFWARKRRKREQKKGLATFPGIPGRTFFLQCRRKNRNRSQAARHGHGTVPIPAAFLAAKNRYACQWATGYSIDYEVAFSADNNISGVTSNPWP